MKTFKIFVSSPGDVHSEREIAARVISRVEAWFGGRVAIDPFFWEHEPVLATRGDFQQQFPTPGAYQLFVCILWSRLGSRLHPDRFRRLDGTTFDSGTEYEFEEALQAFHAQGHPDLLVYRRNEQPRFPADPEEEELRLKSQWRALQRFCEKWFKDAATGIFKTGYVKYRDGGDFERSFEEHLKKLIVEWLEKNDLHPEISHPQRWWRGSPYRGLAAFQFDDAKIFFGRTKACDDVLTALKKRWANDRCPFVMIFGASGSGKSSLMRAGVLPWLVRPGLVEGVGLWRRAILRPADFTGDLISCLAHTLVDKDALPELLADGTTTEELGALLRDEPKTITGLIKGALSQAAARQQERDNLVAQPVAKLALALDQLEEVFTLKERFNTGDRVRFFRALAAIMPQGNVWVIATLRSDFYCRCEEISDLIELKKNEGQYHLLQPDEIDLSQMIRYPAEAAGIVFEDHPKKGKLDEVIARDARQQPGMLPLLQYALEQLYEKGSAGGCLTHEQYADVGSVTDAIAKRADEVLAGLSDAARDSLDGVLRQLVLLTDGIPTACAAQQADLCRHPGGAELVGALVDARLFTIDGNDRGDVTVKIAHEALIKAWKSVEDWIQKNLEFLRQRGRLNQAVRTWNLQNRHPDYLLARGRPLNEASEMLRVHGSFLSAEENDFIEASLDKAARETLLESIENGRDLVEVSRRFQVERPAVREALLLDRLAHGSAREREHIAGLLGADYDAKLCGELVHLALADSAIAVRRTAAQSLVQIDQAECFSHLFEHLEKNPESRVINAIAQVRASVDLAESATSFEPLFAGLNPGLRRRIMLKSWLLRLKRGLPALAFILIPTFLLSAVASSLFKAIPSQFGYAFCQGSPNAGVGIFMAIVACVVWGCSITGCITLHRLVFRKQFVCKSYLQPWASLLASGLTGMMGSVMVMLLLVTVCDPAAVSKFGWTKESVEIKASNPLFWREILFQTRTFWPFLPMGFALGVGMAAMSNGMWASRRLADFMNHQSSLTNLKDALNLLKSLTRLTLPFSWPIPTAMLLGVLLAVAIVRTAPDAGSGLSNLKTVPEQLLGDVKSGEAGQREWKRGPYGQDLGIAFDGAVQAWGGFFCVVGMSFGMVILRYGVEIAPAKK